MEDVSLPMLVIRVVVSLTVVLGVMAAAAALLRRSGVAGLGGGRTSGARARRFTPRRVEVLSRHGLGRNSSVTVLRLGNRALVLGVTESQITLLAETDPADLEPPPPEPGDDFRPPTPANPWTTLVDALRERTVRRS